MKKDEEERLARKRRLDEIMARTRGAGNKSANSTPKKVYFKKINMHPKKSISNVFHYFRETGCLEII